MGTARKPKTAARSRGRRAPATKGRTKLKEKVAKIVREAPHPVTAADIAEEIGRQPEHIYRVIESLHRDGEVQRFKREGVYHVAPADAPLPDDVEVTDREINEALATLKRAGIYHAEQSSRGRWRIRRRTVVEEER